MKSFAEVAVTFFVLGLIGSLLGFGGHAAATSAFRLFYTPFDRLKSVSGVLTLLFFPPFLHHNYVHRSLSAQIIWVLKEARPWLSVSRATPR